MSLSNARDDWRFIWLLRSCALVASGLLFSIAIYLGREIWPLLKAVPWINFVGASSWNPTAGLYNFTPMILGSVLSTALAIALAGPLGILSALFSQFYAPPLVKRVYRACIELLAGIPSVVYGLWGLTVLVPLINRWHTPGASLLAGSLILALMILPTVVLIAESSLSGIPRGGLLAAQALGLSRLAMIRTAVLPYTRSAFFAAILLACGRALGETMAMLMVCGNVVQIPKSIFDPVRTLTANIALEMAYAVGAHRSALFLSGFLLIVLLTLMLGLLSLLRRDEHHAY